MAIFACPGWTGPVFRLDRYKWGLLIHFPHLQSADTFSTPAFSTPAIMPVPHFHSPRWLFRWIRWKLTVYKRKSYYQWGAHWYEILLPVRQRLVPVIAVVVMGCRGGSCAPSPGKKYFLYTGSVVRVSASSSFISVDMFFGCRVMCILFSPSCECF